MHRMKDAGKWGGLLAVTAAVLLVAGCTTPVKHSYDTTVDFSGYDSYDWSASSVGNHFDELLESNVQHVADQVLGGKDFSKTDSDPDLKISMKYEFESYFRKYGYELRMLTIRAYDREDKTLVWQGTAMGPIATDADSGELADTVREILSSFPPK